MITLNCKEILRIIFVTILYLTFYGQHGVTNELSLPHPKKKESEPILVSPPMQLGSSQVGPSDQLARGTHSTSQPNSNNYPWATSSMTLDHSTSYLSIYMAPTKKHLFIFPSFSQLAISL